LPSMLIKSIARTTIVTLLIALVIFLLLLFGDFGRGIPPDKAAAMTLIQKLGKLDTFLIDCKFDSTGKLVSCAGLAANLALLKEENEEILVTNAGEIVGVNFVGHVVVVLGVRKNSDGKIYLSCSVSPKKASPLGCDGKVK
jgi:hypothetical protein